MTRAHQSPTRFSPAAARGSAMSVCTCRAIPLRCQPGPRPVYPHDSRTNTMTGSRAIHRRASGWLLLGGSSLNRINEHVRVLDSNRLKCRCAHAWRRCRSMSCSFPWLRAVLVMNKPLVEVDEDVHLFQTTALLIFQRVKLI